MKKIDNKYDVPKFVPGKSVYNDGRDTADIDSIQISTDDLSFNFPTLRLPVTNVSASHSSDMSVQKSVAGDFLISVFLDMPIQVIVTGMAPAVVPGILKPKYNIIDIFQQYKVSASKNPSLFKIVYNGITYQGYLYKALYNTNQRMTTIIDYKLYFMCCCTNLGKQ